MSDDDGVATAVERALPNTLRRFGLRRVSPALTTDPEVPAATWANDEAFIAVLVEPREPFVLYIGRLVGGHLPAYPVPGPDGWHYLDVDFFFTRAGFPLLPRPSEPPPAALADALAPYDEHLPSLTGDTLQGDFAVLDELIAGARSQPLH